MIALVAASPLLAGMAAPALGNEQLRVQVGHGVARLGMPTEVASELDANALARVKLVLDSEGDRRPALQRLITR